MGEDTVSRKGPHQRGQFDRLHVDDTQCQCIHCSRLVRVQRRRGSNGNVRDPLKSSITWARIDEQARHNLKEPKIA